MRPSVLTTTSSAISIQLPALAKLSSRLLLQFLARVRRIKLPSVPVSMPRRSVRTVVPEAEVKGEVLRAALNVFLLDVPPHVPLSCCAPTMRLHLGSRRARPGGEPLRDPVMGFRGS